MMTTLKTIGTGVMFVVALLLAAGCDRVEDEPFAAVELAGSRVAILITDGFQDEEALHPKNYLSERGAAVTVIGPTIKTVEAYNSDVQIDIEKTVGQVRVDDFDALVIPGGRSPANLRDDADVVSFVRAFYATGRPVAAICHGPQLLIAAGVMEDKKATCFAGISDELVEAGSHYEDSEVVRDGNLITSRLPKDLPVFSAAIADALRESSLMDMPLPGVPPTVPGQPVPPAPPVE